VASLSHQPLRILRSLPSGLPRTSSLTSGQAKKKTHLPQQAKTNFIILHVVAGHHGRMQIGLDDDMHHDASGECGHM
jgi:hypothetical protein